MHAVTSPDFDFASHIMEILLKSCWAISCKEIPNYEKPFPKGLSVLEDVIHWFVRCLNLTCLGVGVKVLGFSACFFYTFVVWEISCIISTINGHFPKFFPQREVLLFSYCHLGCTDNSKLNTRCIFVHCTISGTLGMPPHCRQFRSKWNQMPLWGFGKARKNHFINLVNSPGKTERTGNWSTQVLRLHISFHKDTRNNDMFPIKTTYKIKGKETYLSHSSWSSSSSSPLGNFIYLFIYL